MGHIVERHDANWHRDWDRRHVHFFHNRFFVFDDGFWFGSYPWDYYYPYYDQDYYGYDDSTDPYSVPMVSAVQSDLARQGYYRGVIDGVYGPQTRVAITRYQSKHGLQVTGSLLRRRCIPPIATTNGKLISAQLLYENAAFYVL